MSNRVSYIITDHNITVNYQGQTHIVSRSDALADRLIQAVRERRLEEIPNLVSAAKRIEDFGQGNFTVRDGEILINGQVAPEVLGKKIIRFSNEGLPHEPLVRFAENLLKNPSFRAVNELFQFLEKNDHPITENGCFIAYKKVCSDFLDGHTRTMDNSVGKVVELSRNLVDEDSTRTCSHGLHVANWDYAHNVYSAGDGALMLEVEVNPADVVAVPVDYNQAKMRVCKYLVLGVVEQEHSDGTSLRITNDSVPCEEEDTEEEIEDEECDVCGSADCYDRECEDYCASCGELDCYDLECEEECDECGENGCEGECLENTTEEKIINSSKSWKDIAPTDSDDDPYPWESELDD